MRASRTRKHLSFGFHGPALAPRGSHLLVFWLHADREAAIHVSVRLLAWTHNPSRNLQVGKLHKAIGNGVNGVQDPRAHGNANGDAGGFGLLTERGISLEKCSWRHSLPIERLHGPSLLNKHLQLMCLQLICSSALPREGHGNSSPDLAPEAQERQSVKS